MPTLGTWKGVDKPEGVPLATFPRSAVKEEILPTEAAGAALATFPMVSRAAGAGEARQK